jgi:mevalonate kinase
MNPTKQIRKFNAKVLLFGEYAVIGGGEAVTTPLNAFSGFFDFATELQKDEKALTSNASLIKYHKYLVNVSASNALCYPLNLDDFRQDIENGMFFKSTIPQGYGAGSSGALVAAVFERYSTFTFKTDDEEDSILLKELKKQFSLMESYFHGNSSGVDPLGCYVGKPLFFDGNGNISVTQLSATDTAKKISPFLIDTGQTGMTAPLVEWFKQKMEIKELDADLLKSLSNEALRAFLTADSQLLFNYLDQLSLFQLENMKPMIPKSARFIWFYGLESRLYTLKLCGSGGGGFLLGFTSKPIETAAYFRDKGINPLWLFEKQETRTHTS